MNNSVKDMLDEKAYELLKLPYIEFQYGSLEFFNKDTIDNAQAGFRYNSITGEKIDGWTGDEYVIIGYDSTVGCGPDPYIIKTDDSNLPVYWLISDGGDWSNPDLICDRLETFNKIINMLNEYAEYFFDMTLTSKLKKEILNKISKIEGKNNISDYWDTLLNNAIEEED